MPPTDRQTRKHQRRTLAVNRRAREMAERDRIEEARQEAVVPAADRRPVLMPDGSIYRAARVRADGPAFIKSSAVAHLYRRGSKITTAHLVAADRLLRAWEEGGRSVGMGASLYGERVGCVAKSGISEHVLKAIGRQNDALDDCRAAQWALGRMWPIVRGMVLDGMSAKVWSALRRPPVSPEWAILRLVRALDRLVVFYADLRLPDKPGRIRSAQVVVRSALGNNIAREAPESVDLLEK
jgi:hypothetical protein